MFTEDQLLQLLKVQSNLSPKDFEELFGEVRGRSMFNIFARDTWNLVSYLFNHLNGGDREALLNYVNQKIESNA